MKNVVVRLIILLLFTGQAGRVVFASSSIKSLPVVSVPELTKQIKKAEKIFRKNFFGDIQVARLSDGKKFFLKKAEAEGEKVRIKCLPLPELKTAEGKPRKFLKFRKAMVKRPELTLSADMEDFAAFPDEYGADCRLNVGEDYSMEFTDQNSFRKVVKAAQDMMKLRKQKIHLIEEAGKDTLIDEECCQHWKGITHDDDRELFRSRRFSVLKDELLVNVEVFRKKYSVWDGNTSVRDLLVEQDENTEILKRIYRHHALRFIQLLSEKPYYVYQVYLTVQADYLKQILLHFASDNDFSASLDKFYQDSGSHVLTDLKHWSELQDQKMENHLRSMSVTQQDFLSYLKKENDILWIASMIVSFREDNAGNSDSDANRFNDIFLNFETIESQNSDYMGELKKIVEQSMLRIHMFYRMMKKNSGYRVVIESMIAEPDGSAAVYSDTDFTPVYGRWGQAGSVLSGILALEEKLASEKMKAYQLAYGQFWQLAEQTAVKYGKMHALQILLKTTVPAFDCQIGEIITGSVPASGLLKFIGK